MIRGTPSTIEEEGTEGESGGFDDEDAFLLPLPGRGRHEMST